MSGTNHLPASLTKAVKVANLTDPLVQEWRRGRQPEVPELLGEALRDITDDDFHSLSVNYKCVADPLTVIALIVRSLAEGNPPSGTWSDLSDAARKIRERFREIERSAVPAWAKDDPKAAVTDENLDAARREGGTRQGRQKMTVKEADRKAKELTDSPKKREDFFGKSERKQARIIGCSWDTWRKTECYQDAVVSGWIVKKQKKHGQRQTAPRGKVVSLTPAIEAVHAQGEPDEVLNRLAAEDSAETTDQAWETMPREERLALLKECESENDSDPSPLSPSRKKVRERK